MKKRILSIVICLFLLLSLVACGDDGGYTPSQKAFDEKISSNAPSTDEVIASNSKYTLQYNAASAAIKLVENETGTVWESCPSPTGEPELDDFGLPVKPSSFVQSAISVSYVNKQISNLSEINSMDYSVDGGRVVYKPIENGVTVEYYFDSVQFMVPVDYVLHDDYVSVSIDSTKIQENELEITTVSLAPFLCSVENNTPDSYLFMPSGSGALLSTASYSPQGLMYDADVYGEDLTKEERYDPDDEIAVRMPVYGYKKGDVGGFAIIDNGSDAATLHSTIGNTTYGFSAIYPTFNLRGYTEHEARTFNSTYITKIYPNEMLEGKFSVRFYPLKGENANYTGMANTYRDYLIEECGLAKTGEEKALNLNIIGGTEITKSFLGIPYTTIFATTTVNEANNIITELSKDVKNMSVKLKGFGETGIDNGKVGGGYKLSGNIGSNSQLKSLSDACADKKVDLYFDYELVKFSSSGSGFSFSNDVAMNSGYIKSDQFIIDKAVRNTEEKLKYRLLRPVNFESAVSKALDANAKWNINGVAFDSLTSNAYSDYSDYNETVLYNAKHGFADTLAKSLSQVKKNKQKLMASNANVYAALMADLVTEAPMFSNDGYAFTQDVPFYAMVFKGYVPMTTDSINLATNPEKQVLAAVESGVGLNYTVINTWGNALIDAVYPYFYSTKYSSQKEGMLNTYSKFVEYFESVKDATIVSSSVVSDGVHCTVFNNGVTVYVNYNDTAAQTPAGEVAAMSYITTGGAA